MPMRRLIILMLSLLAACTGSITSQIDSEHQIAQTQIGALRTTVTVQAARLRTTLYFSETRVALAATQSQFLKSTIAAYGTPFDYLEDFQRRYMGNAFVDSAATTTPTPLIPIDATPTAAATSAPATAPPAGNLATVAARRSARETLRAPEPTPTATPDADTPFLRDAVMALGVRDDDCALGLTTIFTNVTPTVYVVMRAYNVTPGTEFASRWVFRDTEIVRHSFTAEFAFDDECIWFYIDESDTTLFVGDWEVTLEIDGEAQGNPLSFRVIPS